MENNNDILKELLNDRSGISDETREKQQLTYDAYSKSEYGMNYDIRDNLYSSLLGNYTVENHKKAVHNRIYKIW